MEILRVILGSTGLIGSAWKRHKPNSIFVNREEIENWFCNQKSNYLRNFLDNLPKDKEKEMHFCLGNTNSMENLDLLMQVNCHWQLIIAQEALMRNFRIITYGSALEDFGIRNNYFESKRAFSSEMGKIETRELWTNVRLHTLYSDSRPHSHMFLGQIYSAIWNASQFKMSSGKQLREFHHVDDVIQTIESALRLNFDKQLELSHGKPIEVLQVAEYLFETFNSRHLLNVNSYPDNRNDNYSKIFQSNLPLGIVIDRDPLSALGSIFARLLEEERSHQ
jgi:hypothetical protein